MKSYNIFPNAKKIKMENNKLMCSKCKKEYSLIKKNGYNECVYIPTLFDKKFEINYEHYFYYINKGKIIYNYFWIYKKNDYIYNRYKNYYPCQEVENLGTEENPLYSCIKCYEYVGKKKNYKESLRITEMNSKVSYCIELNNNDDLKNCKEATYKINNGKEIYNCTKCNKNYILTLNNYTNTYYCQSTSATKKCLALYCKTCNPYDSYTCDECIQGYEINYLTGYCIKKTEVVPAVTWKDIYRLEMNDMRKINNKEIYGPSLVMSGITSSQINTRHSFLIYLTFKIK